MPNGILSLARPCLRVRRRNNFSDVAPDMVLIISGVVREE
jgi:hypothetical protein